jgi:predicted outer membrane repeat protein
VEGDGSTSVELTLDGITVEENVADGDGGGIFLAQVFVEVDDIIVAGNGARNGGGIHCVQCGGAVSTSTLRDNTATADGAGLYVESLTGLSPFDFTDVDVEGNVATDQGGGVYVQGLISRPVSFRRSSFVSNEALDGGAAYVSAVGVLRLDESVVQRNVATQGPAVYIGRPPTTLISQFTATNVDFGVRSGGTNNRQRGTGADVDRHVEVPQASTPLMLDYVGVVPFTGCISTCSVPFTCPIVTQCF